MGRKKLERFADNDQAPNVIQDGKELYNQIQGNWRKSYFKNDNPIVLELGCGRGEYTVGLAEVFPEKNFVGVDIKGSRFWKGSQVALQKNLNNVAFLRIHIQNLDRYVAAREVNEIWITFPDPRPKDRDEKRRLTHPRFLKMYRDLLQEEGIVHLKTDNTGLFDYTIQEALLEFEIKNLKHTYDLYQSEMNNWHHGIKTNYESIFTEQGFKIKYLQFSFQHLSSESK